MSTQQARAILRRHGLSVLAVGGFKSDVYDTSSGKQIRQGIHPEALSNLAIAMDTNRKLYRVVNHLMPVVDTRRKFKVSK